MRQLARHLPAALIAALLWMAVGVWQRTHAGFSLRDAALAELPLTAAVFALALVWGWWRGRRDRPRS